MDENNVSYYDTKEHIEAESKLRVRKAALAEAACRSYGIFLYGNLDKTIKEARKIEKYLNEG